jgi:hypothetical protein
MGIMTTSFEKISFKPWNNLEGIREPADIENNIQLLKGLQSRMENQASPEKQALVEAQLGRFDQLKALRDNLTKFFTDRTNLESEYKTLKEKGDTAGLQQLDEKIGNIEDQISTIKGNMIKLESSIEGLKKNIVTLQREITTHQPAIDQISQQYNTPAESSPMSSQESSSQSSPTNSSEVSAPQASPEASLELSREQKRVKLDQQIDKIRGEYLTAVAYKEQMRRAKGVPSYEDMMRAEEYYQTYQNLKNERINLYAPDEVHQFVTEYTDPTTGEVKETPVLVEYTNPETGEVKKYPKQISMRYKLIADETSALNSDRIRTGVQEGKRPAYIRALDKINKAVGIPGALVSGALINAGMHPDKAAKIAPWVTSGTIAFTGAITGGFGLLGAAMAVPGALATTAAVSTAVQGLDKYILKPVYHDPEKHDVEAALARTKNLSSNDLAQAEKLEQARVHGSRTVVRNTVKATAALGLGSWFGSLFGSQATSASESSPSTSTETSPSQIETTSDTATGTETNTGGSESSNYVHNTESASTTSSTQESVISPDDQITPEQQAQLDEMDRQIAEANKQTEAILAAKAAKAGQTTQAEQTSTGITGRGQVYATTEPSQAETARLYNQASQNNLEATKVSADAYVKGTIINNATGLLVRGVDAYLYLKTLGQNQSGIMGGGGITGVNMIQPTNLPNIGQIGGGITGSGGITGGGGVSNIRTI